MFLEVKMSHLGKNFLINLDAVEVVYPGGYEGEIVTWFGFGEGENRLATDETYVSICNRIGNVLGRTGNEPEYND